MPASLQASEGATAGLGNCAHEVGFCGPYNFPQHSEVKRTPGGHLQVIAGQDRHVHSILTDVACLVQRRSRVMALAVKLPIQVAERSPKRAFLPDLRAKSRCDVAPA